MLNLLVKIILFKVCLTLCEDAVHVHLHEGKKNNEPKPKLKSKTKTFISDYSNKQFVGIKGKKEGETCGYSYFAGDLGTCAEGLFCDLAIQKTIPDMPGKCKRKAVGNKVGEECGHGSGVFGHVSFHGNCKKGLICEPRPCKKGSVCAGSDPGICMLPAVGNKVGEECGHGSGVFGHVSFHGNCKKGLICEPRPCKKGSVCAGSDPGICMLPAYKKVGEECGHGSSSFGYENSHGTCEKGLICEPRPCKEGAVCEETLPGICKRSDKWVRGVGKECGESMGCMGNQIFHGVCEKGLFCEPRPYITGHCEESQSGICKKSANKLGEECGCGLSVFGWENCYGTCEEGLICEDRPCKPGTYCEESLPGICKKAGNKVGEECGHSMSGCTGNSFIHGTCEKGLFCEPRPTREGVVCDDFPSGICKKSGGKKEFETCGTSYNPRLNLHAIYHGTCEEGLVCERPKDSILPGKCHKKRKECTDITDCVQKGKCTAYDACVCINNICTLSWWVDPAHKNKNCRDSQDCKQSVQMCQIHACDCVYVDKNGRGTCLQKPMKKY